MAITREEIASTSWFGGSGATHGVTLTVAAGNLLVLGVGWANTVAITSVASSPSNGWTFISGRVSDGSMSTYYAANTASGSTTITITWAADPGAGSLHVHEVAGAATASVLDKNADNDQFNPGGGANAVTSTAVTTTTNGQYIFGFTWDSALTGGTVTVGTGFTGFLDTGEGQSEYQVQTSAGSVAATFTTTASFQEQLTAVATFKEAGGGGGGGEDFVLVAN